MTRRDMMGAVILALLFVALIVVMAFTYRRKGSGSNDFKNNPIVQQRILNIEKSNTKSP